MMVRPFLLSYSYVDGFRRSALVRSSFNARSKDGKLGAFDLSRDEAGSTWVSGETHLV